MAERSLFELKQKFLSVVPHPKLIQSTIDRLGSENEDSDSESAIANQLLGDIRNLQDFLTTYIDLLLTIRLEISNAQSEAALRIALIKLKNIHLTLIQRLVTYSKELEFQYESSEELKLSEPIDAYKILRFVKDSFKDDNQIKDYLRSLNSEGIEDPKNALLNEIFRSKKILEL
ncbi:hypothetical protein JYT74_01050 [Crocinitomix catalasitica]|nr:hypothetical protein [Crocinitomix catalasitica]